MTCLPRNDRGTRAVHRVRSADGRSDCHCAQGFSLIAAAVAATAVVLGVRFASAATLAVMASVVTAMLAGTPPMGTALAGLAATAYLILRHARNVESVRRHPRSSARWV